MRRRRGAGVDRPQERRYGRQVAVRARCGAPSPGFPARKVGLALTPRQLALRAVELAQSKKAEDIVLLDLRAVTNFADYFVVCTARSDTQLRAVADAVVD